MSVKMHTGSNICCHPVHQGIRHVKQGSCGQVGGLIHAPAPCLCRWQPQQQQLLCLSSQQPPGPSSSDGLLAHVTAQLTGNTALQPDAATRAAVASAVEVLSDTIQATTATADAQRSAVQHEQPPEYTQQLRTLLQQQQQQPSSRSSMLGMLDVSSSRKAKSRSVLGGAYIPGDTWHIRRRHTGRSQPAAAPPTAPWLEQQQQQHIPGVPEEEMDFTLLERVRSNTAASTSGSTHSSSSSSSSDDNVDSSHHLDQPALLGPMNNRDDANSRASQHWATEAVLLQELQALSRRMPSANFKDDRFEQALSRWMKEAPDWFKIRSVYERYPDRFNIVHVACALSCLADKTAARLSHQQVLQVELSALRAFVRLLLDVCSRQLPSIDMPTAAALLHSLARLANTGKLPATYAPGLVSSLLLHIEPYLSTVQPRQLSQLVWALKLLQHQPPQAWCESLYAQTRPQLSQLQGFEAALLLRGLAVIKSPAPPVSWSSAMLSHTEGLLPDMEARHISLLLFGLGGLKVQPPRAWLTAALSALQSKFDSMGPQAMSNIMWAFAQLGVLPDRAWLTHYFKASLQLLDSHNRQELTMDMLSLSKLRLEPGDQWLDEYFDASEAQLARFTLRDLSIVGYAVAKLGLRPPQTWLRRYCALLLQYKAGLYRNKPLLTQVMVALDSFKVPRMDMWRREMYAAAGYKLYKYPNWRQRVRVQPTPLSAGFSRRRMSRRGSGSRVAVGASSSSRVPPVLRSGDWGVMDAMGGAGGVLGGSMGSYEELAAAPSGPASGSGASSSGVVKRPLPSSGLVRPQRPASAARGAWGSSSASSMAEGSATSSLASVSDV